MQYELREYLKGGRSPFFDWFKGLDAPTAARVDRYIRRMESGNFGDSKGIGDGVQELRIHFGAGYRVYYGRDGDTIVILLGGGTKRKQAADIKAATARWAEYKQSR
ncbi:type II toxin-antitoxin system RelE/ParE family toxin [Pontiellaceae bacterium B1224]|nr:type II toxin-antitoxin system RelE/ParE family toxin [Pontiellaceae bacterium B1224]